MERKYRLNVTILFGDPKVHVRQGIRQAMAHEGYRGIREFAQLGDLQEAVGGSTPDLVVLDTHMPGGDACAMVQAIRHNQLGSNPFVPVIFTTWEADADVVRRVVDSGADDLLIKPLSPAQLLTRINSLVSQRKPFIVTSDYIGPERRDSDARASGIPQIEVPNTLKAKAAGETVSSKELQDMVDRSMKVVNEQRLQRNSYQIAFLVDLIVKAYKADEVGPELPVHVARLSTLANETARRLDGTRFEHAGDLCRSLVQVTGEIDKAPRQLRKKDIELLKPLSDALVIAFNPDKDSAAVATEIAGMVRSFAGRANAEARKQATSQ